MVYPALGLLVNGACFGTRCPWFYEFFVEAFCDYDNTQGHIFSSGAPFLTQGHACSWVGKVPLSQNRASEIKFVGPLSSIGAPELSSGAPFLTQGHACSWVGKVPLSQNRSSENKFEEPLSSIGAPELKTVLLSLDGAPEYCHNHKKPPQIENTPEVCTAGSRVVGRSPFFCDFDLGFASSANLALDKMNKMVRWGITYVKNLFLLQIGR